ncbi:hypothetical protein HDU67_006643 [Dinochytrium kinnereticum]|nr:hypothetical protein HDU67_006643 [Dinochytrium kinnereticum]
MKIPSTCTGVRMSRSRSGRPKSLASNRSATPTISRPGEATVGSLATVMYDYEPPSDAPEDEIAVTEGEAVSVLCGDRCGLVPTAYIAIKSPPTSQPAPHHPLPLPPTPLEPHPQPPQVNPAPTLPPTITLTTPPLPTIITTTPSLPIAKEIDATPTIVSPLCVASAMMDSVKVDEDAGPRDSNATLADVEVFHECSLGMEIGEVGGVVPSVVVGVERLSLVEPSAPTAEEMERGGGGGTSKGADGVICAKAVSFRLGVDLNDF